MKLLALEGNRQKLDAGAMFGNAPKALWSRWVETDDSNRMEMACRSLLAQTDDGLKILFETGIGDFFEPKLKQRFGVSTGGHVLLQSLQEVGLQHTDIDYVVLSHVHFDHAGGLLSSWEPDKPSELLFSNARYLVSKKHWQRATNPHPRDRASFIPHLNQLLQDSGRLELVDSVNQHSLKGLVSFEFSNGHTPWMMHATIADLVFCADLIPGIAWMHVPISMGYDRYPELLIDEKTEFLENHRKLNHRLFYTHDPDYACAAIGFDGKRYQAENPQIQPG
ncbi:MBL fold metallo-hydrolase [Marinicella sp. W31]|uniref:MBL fold metallo-hydrolase n=1 Tax=Marinicella sp. W31 TaxID=3023713 RepID=UPI0037577642